MMDKLVSQSYNYIVIELFIPALVSVGYYSVM